MKPELTVAATMLLAFLALLLAYDWTRRPRNGRLFYVQVAVFVVGGFLIVFPEVARRLAHVVGIGRGVDFVLYPTVIWLVRESMVSRRRRLEDEERLTELVRADAIERARIVAASRRQESR